jgi:hypothetical protein
LQLELSVTVKRLEQLEKMEQSFHQAREQLARSEAQNELMKGIYDSVVSRFRSGLIKDEHAKDTSK